jgi:hypothetical protein
MREEPMIADGQTQTREQPHTEKQADLDNADGAIKQQAQRNERAKKGQDVEDKKVTPLQPVKVAAPEYSIVAHLGTVAIPD